ncbi:MAG TPA: CBS domain-containing protein [Gaiellaceae bacterium]|nr:CBS domain-containing protein [Gaiellaceae bacterium]
MRVAEVMTAEVLTVTPETSLKQVAEMLASRGISGAPVVDEEKHVVGVVSEADIIVKERRQPQPDALHRLFRRTNGTAAKRAATTAGEAMTSPAVTVTGTRRVDVAAALMLDRHVNRLPVVDDQGVLVGIVTRADLVRAFVHSDEEIASEIREEVLLRELWLRPEDFELTVDRGEVTVAGHLPNEDERELLIRRVGLVPGVVSVHVRETTHV